MTPTLVEQIGAELILTAILLAGPAVAVSLLVGLVISIFQTLTSIQEQTLAFAPRIVAVGVTLVLVLPWGLELLVRFTLLQFERLQHIAGH